MKSKYSLIYKGEVILKIENPGNHFVQSFKFNGDGEGWHTIYFRYTSIDTEKKTITIEPMMAEKIETSGYEVDKYGIKTKYRTIRLNEKQLLKIVKKIKKWE